MNNLQLGAYGVKEPLQCSVTQFPLNKTSIKNRYDDGDKLIRSTLKSMQIPPLRTSTEL